MITGQHVIQNQSDQENIYIMHWFGIVPERVLEKLETKALFFNTWW